MWRLDRPLVHDDVEMFVAKKPFVPLNTDQSSLKFSPEGVFGSKRRKVPAAGERNYPRRATATAGSVLGGTNCDEQRDLSNKKGAAAVHPSESWDLRDVEDELRSLNASREDEARSTTRTKREEERPVDPLSSTTANGAPAMLFYRSEEEATSKAPSTLPPDETPPPRASFFDSRMIPSFLGIGSSKTSQSSRSSPTIKQSGVSSLAGRRFAEEGEATPDQDPGIVDEDDEGEEDTLPEEPPSASEAPPSEVKEEPNDNYDALGETIGIMSAPGQRMSMKDFLGDSSPGGTPQEDHPGPVANVLGQAEPSTAVQLFTTQPARSNASTDGSSAPSSSTPGASGEETSEVDAQLADKVVAVDIDKFEKSPEMPFLDPRVERALRPPAEETTATLGKAMAYIQNQGHPGSLLGTSNVDVEERGASLSSRPAAGAATASSRVLAGGVTGGAAAPGPIGGGGIARNSFIGRRASSIIKPSSQYERQQQEQVEERRRNQGSHAFFSSLFKDQNMSSTNGANAEENVGGNVSNTQKDSKPVSSPGGGAPSESVSCHGGGQSTVNLTSNTYPPENDRLNELERAVASLTKALTPSSSSSASSSASEQAESHSRGRDKPSASAALLSEIGLSSPETPGNKKLAAALSYRGGPVAKAKVSYGPEKVLSPSATNSPTGGAIDAAVRPSLAAGLPGSRSTRFAPEVEVQTTVPSNNRQSQAARTRQSQATRQSKGVVLEDTGGVAAQTRRTRSSSLARHDAAAIHIASTSTTPKPQLQGTAGSPVQWKSNVNHNYGLYGEDEREFDVVGSGPTTRARMQGSSGAARRSQQKTAVTARVEGEAIEPRDVVEIEENFEQEDDGMSLEQSDNLLASTVGAGGTSRTSRPSMNKSSAATAASFSLFDEETNPPAPIRSQSSSRSMAMKGPSSSTRTRRDHVAEAEERVDEDEEVDYYTSSRRGPSAQTRPRQSQSQSNPASRESRPRGEQEVLATVPQEVLDIVRKSVEKSLIGKARGSARVEGSAIDAKTKRSESRSSGQATTPGARSSYSIEEGTKNRSASSNSAAVNRSSRKNASVPKTDEGEMPTLADSATMQHNNNSRAKPKATPSFVQPAQWSADPFSSGARSGSRADFSKSNSNAKERSNSVTTRSSYLYNQRNPDASSSVVENAEDSVLSFVEKQEDNSPHQRPVGTSSHLFHSAVSTQQGRGVGSQPIYGSQVAASNQGGDQNIVAQVVAAQTAHYENLVAAVQQQTAATVAANLQEFRAQLDAELGALLKDVRGNRDESTQAPRTQYFSTEEQLQGSQRAAISQPSQNGLQYSDEVPLPGELQFVGPDGVIYASNAQRMQVESCLSYAGGMMNSMLQRDELSRVTDQPMRMYSANSTMRAGGMRPSNIREEESRMTDQAVSTYSANNTIRAGGMMPSSIREEVSRMTDQPGSIARANTTNMRAGGMMNNFTMREDMSRMTEHDGRAGGMMPSNVRDEVSRITDRERAATSVNYMRAGGMMPSNVRDEVSRMTNQEQAGSSGVSYIDSMRAAGMMPSHVRDEVSRMTVEPAHSAPPGRGAPISEVLSVRSDDSQRLGMNSNIKKVGKHHYNHMDTAATILPEEPRSSIRPDTASSYNNNPVSFRQSENSAGNVEAARGARLSPRENDHNPHVNPSMDMARPPPFATRATNIRKLGLQDDLSFQAARGNDQSTRQVTQTLKPSAFLESQRPAAATNASGLQSVYPEEAYDDEKEDDEEEEEQEEEVADNPLVEDDDDLDGILDEHERDEGGINSNSRPLALMSGVGPALERQRTKKKLNKMLALFRDDLPTERLAIEELKDVGNRLYLERDYETAVEYFSKAILVFESRFYENCPRDYESKQILAILYGNRAQCYLMLAKNAQGTEPFSPDKIIPEVRYYALRANRDAVLSYTLDPMNAKSFHKRGQALLLLSRAQGRSKSAMLSFQRALQLGTLPPATKRETEQWYRFARKRWDADTPFPSNMQETCAMQ
ncbi:unnamed protein product [Amoebophrya sp. A25]|nr:unnamed protein product [Amoebophrya sp. A25]|eukprot:GSA25T00013694001.1